MTTKTKLLTIIICLCINISGYTQVSNVKQNVRQDKATRSSSSSYRSYSSNSYDEESSLTADLVLGVFNGIIKGISFITVESQKTALSNVDKTPNLISLESNLDFGTNLSEFTLQPSLRGNWGIFASEIRYALLDDKTGSLQSFDWQVLIVRIPIRDLKLNYGIGFTSLVDPKTSYFESSVGFELNPTNSKLSFSGNYRWTSRKSETRYRQEVKITGAYQTFEYGRISFSPMIGVTYQDYFNQDHFCVLNLGVKIRFK
ncbi:hypothetical protein E9993_10955 [Labilibacter sediminis]|nr:hypothetical protein E9993_10955 [Labilibacter sediminis]